MRTSTLPGSDILIKNDIYSINHVVTGRREEEEILSWKLLYYKLSVRLSVSLPADRQTETASCCAHSGSPLCFLHGGC